MKAYCINLDRRPDRRAHMWGEFDRLGLAVERFAAVDGQQEDVRAAASRLPPGTFGQHVSSGAHACFESHRAIWRQLAGGSDDHAVVLEDDLEIAPGFAACLEEGWIPGDAGVVKLETNRNRMHLDVRAAAPAGSRRLVRLRSYHSGTAAYLVSAAAARTFLERSAGSGDPVDAFMFGRPDPSFWGFEFYQMLPAPVTQGAPGGGQAWAATSITDHWAAGAPGERRERPAARLARRLKEELRARLGGTRYLTVPFG